MSLSALHKQFNGVRKYWVEIVSCVILCGGPIAAVEGLTYLTDVSPNVAMAPMFAWLPLFIVWAAYVLLKHQGDLGDGDY